jgi:hypothetical protein
VSGKSSWASFHGTWNPFSVAVLLWAMDPVDLVYSETTVDREIKYIYNFIFMCSSTVLPDLCFCCRALLVLKKETLGIPIPIKRIYKKLNMVEYVYVNRK